MFSRLFLFCVCAVLSLGCVVSFADDRCDETAPMAAEIALDGASRVEVIALAGSLVIEGERGGDTVRATGTACASSRGLLDDIELRTERRGDAVRVEVVIPKTEGWNQQARLDLAIALPDSVAVEVDDGSGSTEIRDVASLRLEDGSGEIDIERVAGDVRIEDGSGSLHLSEVGGAVWITDGSGEIRLSRVAGDIELNDGSGSIEIQGADSNVRISEDGSGSIDVRGVTGNLVVEEDGSGSISVADIGGDFTVERDGSGSVDHQRVSGAVSVPTGR